MYSFLKGRLIGVRLCLLVSALLLIAIGLITIYSVGHPAETSPSSRVEEQFGGYWEKQAVFAVVGLAGFVFINLINYRRLGSISYWIFGFGLISLGLLIFSKYVISLPFAPAINGSFRWLDFSFIIPGIPNIQPSEFFKIIYILTLAWYLRYRSNYRNFKALIGPFALTILPIGMILLEPDLGTTLLMMPVLFTMLFVAGAKAKHLLIILLMAVLVSPLLWHRLESYQRLRISTVLLQSQWIRTQAENRPWLAQILVGTKFTQKQWKTDWGWQLIRSKYAIASGGLKGYGFGRGPFIKYNSFLGKERHNDFIFAIIAHQWGLWGSLVLFGLYIIIVGCGIKIAANNTDPFGRLLAVGIVVMFVVEVVINVGMTMGIMPITGLTLPLVSYGGSSLVVNMICIGLLNNVGRCRPFNLARSE
jgi:rod shape determining protein RodA